MPSNIGLKMRLGAVDKMSSVFSKSTKSIRRLSVATQKATRKFKIMQGQSEKLRKSLSKTGGKMKSIGGQMTIGLTAPILGIGAAIVKTSTDFQAGMNKVEALTGATGKSLDDMRKLARKLGRDTKFSAGEAADAMSFLGMAGFNTNEILKATPAILNLAASSNTDLARSADIASNIMGAFNIEAGQAGRVADVLAKTTASSNTNMEQMAEAMKDAGPIALKYGASIEQTSALIGKLGDAGIQGSKAGTTLKNMFLKISAPTKSVQKLLGSLGVNAVDPLTKKLRPMTDVLRDLNKGFKDKGLTQAKKLAVLERVFGKRAIAGAGVLLEAVDKIDPITGKATNAVVELEKKLNKANGTAARMAKTMQKGLPGALARLKSSTEDMLLSFGFKGGFAGVAEAVIGKLISLTNWISGFSGATLKTIAVVAGLVAVVGPLLAGFGMFLTVLPSIITGWNIIKASMIGAKIAAIGFNLSMLPVIATVGLLATAAFMVWDNWKPIKAFFSDFFTSPLQQIKDMIGFAGKLAGISNLFGFGDDTDEKLKAQGFKIGGPSGEAKGKALGANKVTKQSNDFKLRQQKSQVDINFANMPKNTAVATEDKGNILNISGTGLMGAF